MRFLLAILVTLSFAGAASADTHVRGYTRKDGTYVEPHMRSNADSSRFNNFSTRGNTNPYTGESGKVDPYKPPKKPSGF